MSRQVGDNGNAMASSFTSPAWKAAENGWNQSSQSLGNIWVIPNMQYIFISPSYVIYWTEMYWTKLKL